MAAPHPSAPAPQLPAGFDGDNRAGIDGTLHRISAMRSRVGRVVGLTCRVGRAVEGSAALVADLAAAGESILLLGRPGEALAALVRRRVCGYAYCRIAAIAVVVLAAQRLRHACCVRLRLRVAL
jgi:stage III sporulation protein SpoIIIAA